MTNEIINNQTTYKSILKFLLGAAFLVKNKLEGGKEYIAKKILLGALG